MLLSSVVFTSVYVEVRANSTFFNGVITVVVCFDLKGTLITYHVQWSAVKIEQEEYE